MADYMNMLKNPREAMEALSTARDVKGYVEDPAKALNPEALLNTAGKLTANANNGVLRTEASNELGNAVAQLPGGDTARDAIKTVVPAIPEIPPAEKTATAAVAPAAEMLQKAATGMAEMAQALSQPAGQLLASGLNSIADIIKNPDIQSAIASIGESMKLSGLMTESSVKVASAAKTGLENAPKEITKMASDIAATNASGIV